MDATLAETPQHFPHVCLDGRQDGPVVNTNHTIPGYGILYLSRQQLRDYTRLVPEIVVELASEIGWMSAVEHEETVGGRDSKITELEGRLAELEPVERALNAAASRFAEVEK